MTRKCFVAGMLLSLLFFPVVSAAQGDSPATATPIQVGTASFDSTSMPSTSEFTPQSCKSGYGTYNGPFYRAMWFRFHAVKAIKVADVTVGPLYIEGQPYPFLMLTVFRENADGSLAAIACSPDRGDVVFGNNGETDYLVLVASYADIACTGALTITTSDVGVLVAKFDEEYGWFSWGLDESGFTTIVVFMPGASCESWGQSPVHWFWTALRTGLIHTRESGAVYTGVYRIPSDQFDPGMFNVDFCPDFPTALAAGRVNYTSHDNNANVTGGKSDTWGITVAGILDDRTGLCPGGKANLVYKYEFIQCPEGLS